MTLRGKSFFVNALTFARVPLIFAWAAFAVCQEFMMYPAPVGRTSAPCGSLTLAILACASMLFSGLTDLWDGRLARKWNVVSTLGKMADPLMDKVFYIVAFPTLLWQAMHQGGNDFHAIFLLLLTIFYMLRDTWVTFMRSIGTMYGADVAAMQLGKVRTALSFPGAGWVYMYFCFRAFAPASWDAPWLASCYFVEGLLLVLTLVSLFTYTRAYTPYLHRALTEDRR